MAIFTSTNGYFEITDISFSPNKVIAEKELGSYSGLQKTTYSITIKNVSGKKITGLSLYMTYGWLDAQGEEDGSDICFLYGDLEYQKAITWNANTTKTFTGEWDILYSEGYEPVFSAHALKPYYSTQWSRTELLTLTVIPNPEDYCDSFSDISGENQKYLAVLDGFYSPSVVTFDADRVASDEDPNIKTSVKLSLVSGLTDTQKSYMKWHAYVDGTEIEIDSSVTIDQLLTGITDSTTFITHQFDKNSDHNLTLTFGDEYELTTSGVVVIPRGFANLHLSGAKNGGICAGGFSKSTDDNPMFECYYPAYFYGGIAGIKSMQCGRTDIIASSKTAYTDVAVTFPTVFTETPTVMLTLETGSTAYAMGNFLMTVLSDSVTTTGFTMRLFNNTSTNRAFYVNWLAYGQM